MTLTGLSHPCAAVLSTYVHTYIRGVMLGAKRWSWSRTVTISKSLIVTSPPRLSKETRHSCVAEENILHYTNHCTSLDQRTPPMPVLEESVVPNQEAGKGTISRR